MTLNGPAARHVLDRSLLKLRFLESQSLVKGIVDRVYFLFTSMNGAANVTPADLPTRSSTEYDTLRTLTKHRGP
jgi:hypothetical protein